MENAVSTPDVEQPWAELGLSADEYQRIREILGRRPTGGELAMYSVMWSEHCSYKSSKKYLRRFGDLPQQTPLGPLLAGIGDNAGVVDIGNGLAVTFKAESHNHPSYVEPHQGAATGVGGIVRDIMAMGARPIACLNALSFGAPEHPKTRHLVSGVVAGVGGYGNSFGVPTVGGQVRFHTRYDGNILVNAMAVGLADADKIFYAAASGVNMPIVYLGSKTGRDGIHGASMASAEFDDASEEKRPTVQVGDPFTEKCLLEACLDLLAPALEGPAPVVIDATLGMGGHAQAVLEAAPSILGKAASALPELVAELIARVEALARRRETGGVQTVLKVGDLEMNLIGRTVHRGTTEIDLQPREFQLLEFLMRHAGQSVTRTMLLEKVWEYHFDPQTNVIDVHISRLRSKIDKGFAKAMLQTVRGAGYRLEA